MNVIIISLCVKSIVELILKSLSYFFKRCFKYIYVLDNIM